jgi:hypothetical protein
LEAFLRSSSPIVVGNIDRARAESTRERMMRGVAIVRAREEHADVVIARLDGGWRKIVDESGDNVRIDASDDQRGIGLQPTRPAWPTPPTWPVIRTCP